MTKCLEHKVCDTHKRTLAIQLTDKVFEVLFDTFVLSYVTQIIYPSSSLARTIPEMFGVSLVIEGFCFGLGYINLRLWNKISWGRKIEDKKDRKAVEHGCSNATLI